MGRQSFLLQEPPAITSWASVAGKKEKEGPLGYCFDATHNDGYFGEKTWEQGEKRMQQMALEILAKKAGMKLSEFGLVLSGDLLNQCIGSSFSLRNTGIPHLGLYGACSTMAESLLVGSMVVCGGFSDNVVAMTSSHFASSERQYRFPLNYGGQRTPTAQWTVTGSGALVLKNNVPLNPRVNAVIFGKIRDLGITDTNNMGAAMAPAASLLISEFLNETHTTPDDFDLILTGDLGKVGSDILKELLIKESNIDISAVHNDCGIMIYDAEAQDVHAGGSGCGCSASVVCSYIINKLRKKELNRVLFVGTGALLSPTSSLQGESVPGIAHGVLLTSDQENSNMNYCLKTLKNIEKITKAYKSIYVLKKVLSAFLIIYTGIKVVTFFMNK